MTFMERFLKCVNTNGYCELKAAVKTAVAKVAGTEAQETI